MAKLLCHRYPTWTPTQADRGRRSDAALSLLAEHGLDGLNLRAVAARLDASPGTLYNYLLTNHNALDTTASLLGLESAAAVAKLVSDLPTTGDGRAQVLTLALVLGALESRTPKDAWRSSTPN